MHPVKLIAGLAQRKLACQATRADRSWLTILGLIGLALIGTLSAQEKQILPPSIRKTPEGYLLVASGLEFRPPKDWIVRTPEEVDKFPAFSLRRRLPMNEKQTLEVTFLVMPMEEIPLNEIVEQEVKVLQLIYKAEQVADPTEVELPTQPPRKGYRILLRDGPSRNGQEESVLYLFSTSDDPKTGWRVRLRGVWNKAVSKEAAAEMEKLLPGFRIHKPESP